MNEKTAQSLESGGKSVSQNQLLLIAADLEERRLLLAELLEAGHDVLPLPGLVSAVRAILMRLVTPSLILLDAHGDERATPANVEELLGLMPEVPLILVVSAINSSRWEPLRPRLAELLRRPIRVGEVVAAVNRQRVFESQRDGSQ